MTRTVLPLLAAALAGALSFAPAAQAGIFGHKDHAQAAAQAAAASSADADIQRAIEEERYVDARNMLDEAVLAGDKDPMLSVLVGELGLAQKSYEESLAKFKEVDGVPSVRARALQGEGVALAGLGRSKDAIKTLEAAVAADPNAWRAWNVLGQEYDDQRDWAHADAAYDRAETLFGQAMKAKGEYYARAATNLEMVQALKARASTGDKKTASNAP